MGIAETILQEWKKQDPFLSDIQGYERYFEKRFPVLHREAERKAKRQIRLSAEALAGPLVVYPGGWYDSLPKWILYEVQLQRLLQLMRGEEGEATDVECVAYLYTASFVVPFDHDWTEIYVHLVKKVMSGRGKNVDIIDQVVDEVKLYNNLNNDQMMMLRDLKREIWNKVHKH